MRNLLPRLRNLLRILANDSQPVPVKEMADRLRVSRRTVFRELANIEPVLEPYGLRMGSKPGEGLLLEGSSQGRTKLRNALESMEGGEPADRRDRHQRLLLALLRYPGQKLLVHADRLKVSAATISHDLDEIEPWLVQRRLELSRKSGSGIAVEGSEAAIRRAILGILHARSLENDSPPEYPNPDIALDLRDLAEELDPLLDWMTPQSREALDRYLAVAVQRLLDGYALTDAAECDAKFFPTAERLATLIGECFDVSLGRAEKAALALELSACRPKAEARQKGGGRDESLLNLAHRMLDLFDPELAPHLKLDDTLIDGLVTHLRSAVVRLTHGVEIADPLLDQMARAYPEVMAKSRQAGEALRPYGDGVPDDEISFLAAHFGAALLRLSDQGARRRTARIGVVCIYGIGTAYLLSSQVKKAFGSRVDTEVGWWDDSEGWKRFDFLISTTPLPGTDLPVVVVPPILGDAEIGRIEEQIAHGGRRESPSSGHGTAFLARCRALENLAADAREIVENFAVIPVDGATDFAGLAATAGRLFGAGPAEAESILAGFLDRERISSQVIPELELVLLHCRTGGVSKPLFSLLLPEGGKFAAREFSGARVCMVMLIPDASPRERTEMLGGISAALVKDEHFLSAVLAGDPKAVLEQLEDILRGNLFQFAVQNMKG